MILRFCSAAEVVGQKKGAKQKLRCKEYLLKWKKRIDFDKLSYKYSISDLVPPWDSCNFYSENCYCYNMFHKIQFKKGQLP